jgi:threonine dehydrogenase-like Zn-dependent dehydrogenase
VDSERPKEGPAAKQAAQMAQQFDQEVQRIAKDAKPQGDQWKPGDAPSQAVTWAVETLAKAGTLGIVGVYPKTDRFFPIGTAINKNLTVSMGNCNHRTYIPKLVEMVEGGTVDPMAVLSHVEPMSDVIEAYRQFDLRRPGWIKVELKTDA